ncbi:hypothetical protein TNCV_1911071 [Trichonephila clavipes]|nr:hypothetical protein TNCV_1911071 [Trichonephila clavipes]
MPYVVIQPHRFSSVRSTGIKAFLKILNLKHSPESLVQHVWEISQSWDRFINTQQDSVESLLCKVMKVERFLVIIDILDDIEVKVGITFLDGDRFNSCQVIYSQFGLDSRLNTFKLGNFISKIMVLCGIRIPDFHKRILFSDEAHFWLNGYVDKQNCRIWSEANP